MAFGGFILTNAGRNLLAQIQAGQIQGLNFTKFAVGDGTAPASISTMTTLVSSKKSVPITNKTVKDGTTNIMGTFSNESLETGFYFKEWGIFASNGQSEVLYAYDNAGTDAEFIAPAGSVLYEKRLKAALVISGDISVTITTSGTQYAELGADGKVLASQLPEISSSAENITITDTAGNFTATNVEGVLAELFQSANDGKTAIRNAMSAKGVTVSLEDTFTLLASKIAAQMCKFGGTATVTDVLIGKTFINNSGEILTGTMANQGAKNASLNAGGSYTIPAGYHNGNGVISANSLASQTSGTATATNILSGYTAWVGGIKITGTMTNNGAIASALTTQGGQYTIPAGYHNGSGKVTANISNLVAINIKKGVNVGGVVGTYEETTKKFLYNSGDECSNITGGWLASAPIDYPYCTGATLVKNSGNMVMTNTPTANTSYRLSTNNLIDFTSYSKIKVSGIINFADVTSSVKSCITLNKFKNKSNEVAGIGTTPSHTTYVGKNLSFECMCDISTISGSYYPEIALYAGAFTIEKIWLE